MSGRDRHEYVPYSLVWELVDSNCHRAGEAPADPRPFNGQFLAGPDEPGPDDFADPFPAPLALMQPCRPTP